MFVVVVVERISRHRTKKKKTNKNKQKDDI